MEYAGETVFIIGKAVENMGTARNLCKADKKELKRLASDFELLGRSDVQEIIETCKNYSEGQRAIMRIYTAVYMQ